MRTGTSRLIRLAAGRAALPTRARAGGTAARAPARGVRGPHIERSTGPARAGMGGTKTTPPPRQRLPRRLALSHS
eukprot:9398620-Alexandrium_andersonii.AAC.1